MPDASPLKDYILVTGGTSGLGLELVRILLKDGCKVVATGRHQVDIHDHDNRYSFCRVDFSNLSEVSDTFHSLAKKYRFGTVVCNAGILSPPEFTLTSDGLEYTFQVNFLAHLLMNEILLREAAGRDKLRITSVTSPVYRIADMSRVACMDKSDYKPIRAYASSKYSLAMMQDILRSAHAENSFMCFSFDPGTFSSGIYRMQKRWFRVMYHIAAPFMRDPAKVARALSEVLRTGKAEPGMIYDIRQRVRSLPEKENFDKESFIDYCYGILRKYL